MRVLNYAKWENFENIINKAKIACQNSGQSVENHFPEVRKMVLIGHSANSNARYIEDYNLTKYACYLITQNGDPHNPTIAQAQTYFAIQTHRQEVSDSNNVEMQRIQYYDRLKISRQQLNKTAEKGGVTNPDHLQSLGIIGLYGQSPVELKVTKNLGQDDLYDRIDRVELAANNFITTQTEEIVTRKGITGQGRINETHLKVGQKTRKTILELGGTPPELLPTVEHIDKVKQRQIGPPPVVNQLENPE
ncbi:MAG: DNA-damage-inducible protein D [Candidatus Berkelbacteria bacterium Gr01-1014_85]|uniref:DNA-damage-inducible protein D n=1 Tax=Candidatus Berkelbacteria bacterium Gr01-1014_85 TaxID=2017150 RepID=A0A554JDZ4_9BACT|nr:MAG: DNA-damage-inducible protein D [Candidatus Berkelbacteria bacterium Gr01-1014_85]